MEKHVTDWEKFFQNIYLIKNLYLEYIKNFYNSTVNNLIKIIGKNGQELVIREKLMKTTMRYHYTLTKLAKMKKNGNSKGCEK